MPATPRAAAAAAAGAAPELLPSGASAAGIGAALRTLASPLRGALRLAGSRPGPGEEREGGPLFAATAPMPPGVPPEQWSFAELCNRKRARLDTYVDAFVLLTYAVAIAKWWHLMPTRCLVAFVGHVLLCSARWAWSAAHPASYLRWRELAAAGMMAYTMASPIPTVVLLDMARGLGKAAARLGAQAALPPGWFHHPVLFSAGLVFTSRAQKMALLSLGYRTRLCIHLPLSLALLVLTLTHNSGVCQAVLSEAGLGAGEGVAAIKSWHTFFSTFSGLSLLYLLPLPAAPVQPSARHDAMAQCRSVVSMLQVAAGFLVPLAVHAVGESREFVAHCHNRPRRADGGSGGGDSEQLQQAREEGGWLGKVYWAVWETAGGRGWPGAEVLLFGALLLGAAWLAISAAL